MTKGKHVPDHWETNDWEEKARENPLHAIMTVDGYRDKSLDDLAQGAPREFLDKGRLIYSRMVEEFLTPEELSRKLDMFDYGCGAGRIMNAVVEAGHNVYGADISQTMIETCRKIVPSAQACEVVAENGNVDLSDERCDVAYSFAVLQHIKSLAAYEKAINEMARIVKPGGLLSIQVNCEDFEITQGDLLGRTVNFEDFSIHFSTPEEGPVRVHEQNNWSGVYIGLDRLTGQLNRLGFYVAHIFNWNEKKKRAMVVIARKKPGSNVRVPRADVFMEPNARMYRALLKKYARVAMDRARYKKEIAALKEATSKKD